MTTETLTPPAAPATGEELISIPVPANMAQAYREASPELRKKWHLLIRMYLDTFLSITPERFTQLFRDMGEKAREAGLTEEMLTDILNEDDDAGRD